MAGFCGRILLPLILLAAATLERSLISLADLLVFFVVQFTVPKNGYHFRRKCLVYWYVVVSSIFIIFAQVLFHVLWLIRGKEWSVTRTWWAKLIGFVSVQPGGSTSMPYFLALQLAAVLVSMIEIFGRSGCDIFCRKLSLSVENIGSHLRVACCLLLPAVQLVVGISHPSWMSLPFFVCSCIGLVDWSLSSNFLGLFRWWRFLLTYAGVSIALLYVYQLPIMLPNIIQKTASFIGFYKSYEITDWTQAAGGISLLTFFFMLSCVRFDLYEMDSIMSTPGRSLTEQLLPSRHLFFIRESRSGVKSTNVFLKGAVYRNFSINFFTYGFPG